MEKAFVSLAFLLPVVASAGVIASTEEALSQAQDVVESSEPYEASFKAYQFGYKKECVEPKEDRMATYSSYGAVQVCFSYGFRADASIETDLTNAVWDVITIGGTLPISGAVLWMPTADSFRFEVKTQNESYKLCDYWKRSITHLPPPGKYTDSGFRNVTETSIDYWYKLKQRGLGKNARISGVAEALFVPSVHYEKAIEDGLCKSFSQG